MHHFIKEGLTFDDLMLVPAYSTLESRAQVDLSVKLGKFFFSHPIVPANMLTITGREMALTAANNGGMAILNRFISLQEQLDIAADMYHKFNHSEYFGVSVGIKPEDKENIRRFMDLGVKIICIDIAHGDSKHCVEMVEWIRRFYTNVLLIAGNVATGSGAKRLWEAGADVVKVGVGSGSLCTTRIQTGNGVPQLTALMEVAEARYKMSHRRPLWIMSDGGAKNSGDLVKSLCFADMVMSGNLFAGCSETPGNRVMIDGVSYKEYVGSSTHKTSHVEGVAALAKYRGKYKDVLDELLQGVRSGLSYQGAYNLEELRENPTFVRITNAGLVESHPHDVKVIR